MRDITKNLSNLQEDDRLKALGIEEISQSFEDEEEASDFTEWAKSYGAENIKNDLEQLSKIIFGQ